jgi:hypothetical protein
MPNRSPAAPPAPFPRLVLLGWRLYDRLLAGYARRGPLRDACTAVMRRFGINRCEVDLNELEWVWIGTRRRYRYRGVDLDA